VIDAEDRLVGVVSVHHERPHRPSSRDLELIEHYVGIVCDAVDRHVARTDRPVTARRYPGLGAA
jgi:GAF domain-containing protein